MRGAVIITGARAPVAQDLGRAVREAGYDVHFADSASAHAARAMRPRFSVHRVPSPRQDFAGFRRAVVEMLASTGAIRIIPTCEEVFWVSAAASLDGYQDIVFAPPLDVLRTLHSKFDFIQLAKRMGADVPETDIISDPSQIANFQEHAAELVFKPEFSRFATHTKIGPTQQQLGEILPTLARRWVVQRCIRGDEICSWAALSGGKLMAFVAYRPRWRLGHAAGFFFEAIDSPDLRRISERVGAATGMTGNLSFDAIADTDGRTLLIECNPRTVSGVHLFDASADLARSIIDGIPVATPAAGSMRHLGPAMVLLGVPVALWHGRLASLQADWRASRDVVARDGSLSLYAASFLDAAGFAMQALRSATSPARATTADIEWDGEAMH